MADIAIPMTVTEAYHYLQYCDVTIGVSKEGVTAGMEFTVEDCDVSIGDKATLTIVATKDHKTVKVTIDSKECEVFPRIYQDGFKIKAEVS